jgi:hypothetical protein
MDSDTRTAGLALAINAAPNWTICACADLFFPLRRETNIRRSGCRAFNEMRIAISKLMLAELSEHAG